MVKVFKFGGASVKDPDSVKNVLRIMKLYENENIAVVISAMGKTTNAFEDLINAYYSRSSETMVFLDKIRSYHYSIMAGLFADSNHPIYKDIDSVFLNMEEKLQSSSSENYDYEYDQLVCLGEVLSTLIVSSYLNDNGVKNRWVDSRNLIITDNTYRDAKVLWDETEQKIKSAMNFSAENVYITQGFIGSTKEKISTTLGREGSDYTAAIIAYSLNAESVIIWKDVPGVLNADPKYFSRTEKLENITYHDAIELAYYGASVIHPKTIKPLQNKKISLYVKSFVDPAADGSVVSEKETFPKIPSFIFKINQALITISPKDFSFIGESNFSNIFSIFSDLKIRINVMQNTAISFSVSVDNDERKVPLLINRLEKYFNVKYNTDNIELITIRYYDQQTIDRVSINKEIILEEKSRHTVQIVVRKLD